LPRCPTGAGTWQLSTQKMARWHRVLTTVCTQGPSVWARDESFRDPPEVPARILNAPLPIVVRQVGNLHNPRCSGSESSFHRCVSVVDVQIIGSWHGRVFRRSLADHDRRCSKSDLSIGNSIAVHMAANLLATQALDKKCHETSGTIDEEVGSNRIEARWNKHNFLFRNASSL
jgi:hypothetical protein